MNSSVAAAHSSGATAAVWKPSTLIATRKLFTQQAETLRAILADLGLAR